MTEGRNALTWGMFEPDPNNALNARPPTQADAWGVNAPVLRDAWAAAQDPQTWQDAAQQYGQALLAGSVAPGAKGMRLDPAALRVLREMTPGFRAYHGSPHSFDRFSSDKIGTGEGAQAYGHGLYLADSEGVARSYRDKLAPMDLGQSLENKIKAVAQDPALGFPEAIQDAIRRQLHTKTDMKPGGADGLLSQWQKDGAVTSEQAGRLKQGFDAAVAPPGHMYEVQVNADPAHFLDWDKPLSEQSPHVQQALAGHGLDPAITGSAAYQTLAERAAKPSAEPVGWGSVSGGPGRYDGQVHDPAAATTALRAAGIPGIRYLDGGSRAGGEGSRNTVIFDANTIAILRKYGIAGLIAGGGAAAAGKDQPQ